MRERQTFRNLFLLYFILCLMTAAGGVSASFREDPIEATQSDVVLVTDELLTREGEPGPASPTFKISDTARFLVKKPYEYVENEDETLSGEASDLWEGWFSWGDQEEDLSISEPLQRE